jgi:hypothetical protein
MDRLHVLRSGRPGQTEHFAAIGVEPVREKLDRVLRLDLDIGQVGLRDLLGRDARQIVTVHEERHRIPHRECAIVPIVRRRSASDVHIQTRTIVDAMTDDRRQIGARAPTPGTPPILRSSCGQNGRPFDLDHPKRNDKETPDMTPASRLDLRAVRLALALSITGLALLASVAFAAASLPAPIPVEPDGGIGGDIVLPVEPDGGIGD